MPNHGSSSGLASKISFAYFLKLRFQIGNGRTLCLGCHRKTDTFGIKARNYKIDDSQIQSCLISKFVVKKQDARVEIKVLELTKSRVL